MGRSSGLVALLLLVGCAKEPLVLHAGAPPTDSYKTTAVANPGYFEVQVLARCAEDARLVGRFLVDPTGEYIVHGFQENRGSIRTELDRIRFSPRPHQGNSTQVDLSWLP